VAVSPAADRSVPRRRRKSVRSCRAGERGLLMAPTWTDNFGSAHTWTSPSAKCVQTRCPRRASFRRARTKVVRAIGRQVRCRTSVCGSPYRWTFPRGYDFGGCIRRQLPHQRRQPRCSCRPRYQRRTPGVHPPQKSARTCRSRRRGSQIRPPLLERHQFFPSATNAQGKPTSSQVFSVLPLAASMTARRVLPAVRAIRTDFHAD